MAGEKKPAQLVKSLDRALDILERLVTAEEGLGVTELANGLGLHKSTVYRILSTLNYRDYVQQDKKTGKYKTGIKLFEVGSKVLNNLDLRTQARPFLEEIVEKTNETVHLGILDKYEVVYIDKVESTETIRMHSRIGYRAPLHSTSLGKVILAFSSDNIVKKVIENKGLIPYTVNTITAPEEFKEELVKIKKQGYAVDNEEQERGIRCIAGPIFDHNKVVIGAFSISGPTFRMTRERTNSLSELILFYSKQISAFFGFNNN